MKALLTASLLTLLLALPALPAGAVAPEGVTFTTRHRTGEAILELRNAALLRYLKLVKVYVAALYLPERLPAEAVLGDVPKRLEIAYLVPLRAADFARAADPVLQRNLTAGELAALRERLARLNGAYRDVQPGDRYALTYLPGSGTELTLNGTPLITIEGADFAAAYFGIWLGAQPIDAGLKHELLAPPPRS